MSMLETPPSTLEYTMGVTIKKEITTDRFREGTQISARMIKEATGMDLITLIRGAVRSRTGPNREDSTARTVPARQARRNPRVIRQKENRMALQNPSGEPALPDGA